MVPLARRVAALIALSFLLTAVPVRADLVLLGNGIVLDNKLGVSFLQDLNTARTSGYDNDGLMTWFEAIAWVEHLNDTRHLGYSDWELASGPGAGSEYPLRTQANYLERLIYGELGNARPAPGSAVDTAALNLGPFVNLGASLFAGYWVWPELAYDGETDPACLGSPSGNCYAYSYRILEDTYDGDPTDYGYYATAMRRPASIPEPGSLAMLAAGVLGWVALRRRLFGPPNL